VKFASNLYHCMFSYNFYRLIEVFHDLFTTDSNILNAHGIALPMKHLHGRIGPTDGYTGTALPVGPIAPEALKELLESQRFEELTIEFDIHERILWYFMSPVERPSATVGLMADIKRLQALVRTIFDAHNDPADPPNRYMALSSRMPGIFNLGGDLALFAGLIRERNRDALDRYARLSIDVIHANAVNLELPMITASVVQGDALGGGFEAVRDPVIDDQNRRHVFTLQCFKKVH
jgi:hypothetical protein